MTIYSKRLDAQEFWGIGSIRGGNHKKAKVPNQDAVYRKKHKFGLLMAVADGVGSHRYSQFGSKAAVRAAAETFYLFETGQIPRTDITKTIFEQFQRKIPNKYMSQASTTCMFAYLSNKSGLYLGQVGDGLCCVKINDQMIQLKEKGGGFGNLVRPLNPEKESPKWKTKHFHVQESDTIQIFLSTDGISGDVISGKEENCLAHFVSLVENKCKWTSDYQVKSCLKNWDAPTGGDDKTAAVYIRRPHTDVKNHIR